MLRHLCSTRMMLEKIMIRISIVLYPTQHRENAYSLHLTKVKLTICLMYTRNTQTLVHLLKGSLGTGILAMPQAFYYAGYASGVLNTIFITFISTYCLLVLVSVSTKCSKHLNDFIKNLSI